jgi:hypothetical protein
MSLPTHGHATRAAYVASKWRRDNPAQYRANQQRYKRKKRDWLDAQKRSWCLDCGYIGPPEAMDFDHRPGEEKTLPLAGAGWSLVNLAREILKCDLVCACCHRIRTAARAGGGRYGP